jgi:hypothetical protein
MQEAETTLTPIRASVFIDALPAAYSTGTSPVGRDPITADDDLVRLCEQHKANKTALDACSLDADDSPHWPSFVASSDAIAAARPTTLAGLAAKARTAKREALTSGGGEDPCNGAALAWAWDLVNDLIRLDETSV